MLRKNGLSRMRRDYDCVGRFKSYTKTIVEKTSRPLFSGVCQQCNPTCIDLALDPHLKDLSLVDILKDMFGLQTSLVSSFWDAAKVQVCVLYLKYFNSSIIYHPGQVEVLAKVKQPMILFVEEVSIENLLSIYVVLQSAGLSSIRIYIDELDDRDWIGSLILSQLGCLYGATEQISLDDRILSDLQESLVVLTRESSSLIEKLIDTEQDVMISQSVVSLNGDQSRIDFSLPVSLKEFTNHNRHEKSVLKSFSLHLNYSRTMLRKPSLVDCLVFLCKHRLVVGEENDLLKSLNILREEAQIDGRDLSFTGESTDLLEQFNHNSFLSGCSRSVDRFYLLESVISVSLLSLVPSPIRVFRGYKKLNVNREKLIVRAEDLYKLLGYQNVCQRPCEDIRTRLNEGLNRLENRGIISSVREGISYHASAVQARKIAKNFDSSSDEESGFFEDVRITVSTSMNSICLLNDFASMIREDLLKMYYCCLKMPVLLNTGSVRLVEFSRIVQDYLQNLKSQGISAGVQMEVNDVQRNISALEQSGAVNQMVLRGETWITVHEDFNCHTKFVGLIKLVSLYLVD